MKITSVQATTVSVPTKIPCAWSLGTGVGFTRTILELGTDSGLVGLGECGISAAAHLLNGKVGKGLMGMAVDDIAAIRRQCRVDFRDHGSITEPGLMKTYAAVEMALLDLQGKAAGLPVFKLLGGAARNSAEFGAYAYTIHLESSGFSEAEVPHTMAKRAAESVARTGASVFEFKIGRFAIPTDIETIRAVRHALGDEIILGVDANQALTISGTRRLLNALADIRIDWFEEPVASMEEMARLHGEYPRVALSTHCIDPGKLRRFPSIEGVVGDLQMQGGFYGMMRSAAVFQALGHQYWQRASLELGIAWAAMVHIGVACQEITRASQSLIDYVEDDLILGDPWVLKGGVVVPPNRPGLGVELDRPALAHYAEEHARRGDLTYFDLK